MTARLFVGDVFDRMADLDDGSYDLIITSPPFLALRSYLPDGHPLKHKEIGSEATPAAFLDVMLALTAEWGRLLAPHGSIAIEIGDTYSGSGGAGGDYGPDGLRAGQPEFQGSAARNRDGFGSFAAGKRNRNGSQGGDGWPLPKSLAMIPELYAASLAYGRNLLTGQPSPAGRWRVRNFKPWIRSNPPVGSLGDKERPATSYVTVATRAVDRYFDLDSVRTAPSPTTNRRTAKGVDVRANDTPSGQRDGNWSTLPISDQTNPAGAPPLDWNVDADTIIDNVLDERAGKTAPGGNGAGRHRKMHGGADSDGEIEGGAQTVGARGVHIRRALQAAGILPPLDAYDISPKGYPGAHYAVWPPELVKQLLAEMCPRRVCTTCGKPSRRIETAQPHSEAQDALASHIEDRREASGLSRADLVPLLLTHYKNAESVTAQISNWERAKNVPAPRDWELLKGAIGVSEAFDPYIYGDRKWTESLIEYEHVSDHPSGWTQAADGHVYQRLGARKDRLPTAGWSDCGHGTWRPARILDPFTGSGTTLAVATGHGIHADGIDIDETNIDLCRERVGMFLDVIDTDQQGGRTMTDTAPL